MEWQFDKIAKKNLVISHYLDFLFTDINMWKVSQKSFPKNQIELLKKKIGSNICFHLY